MLLCCSLLAPPCPRSPSLLRLTAAPHCTACPQFSSGKSAAMGARIVYIDGAFDLFHVGHVEILKASLACWPAGLLGCWAQLAAWNGAPRAASACRQRCASCPPRPPPPPPPPLPACHPAQKAKQAGDFLLVGVHTDEDVTERRGPHLPIMGLHERALSVLSCRYVDEVVIGAWVGVGAAAQRARGWPGAVGGWVAGLASWARPASLRWPCSDARARAVLAPAPSRRRAHGHHRRPADHLQHQSGGHCIPTLMAGCSADCLSSRPHCPVPPPPSPPAVLPCTSPPAAGGDWHGA